MARPDLSAAVARRGLHVRWPTGLMTCEFAVGSAVAYACGVSSVAVDLKMTRVAQGPMHTGHGTPTQCLLPSLPEVGCGDQGPAAVGTSHRGVAHVLKELNKLFVRSCWSLVFWRHSAKASNLALVRSSHFGFGLFPGSLVCVKRTSTSRFLDLALLSQSVSLTETPTKKSQT